MTYLSGCLNWAKRNPGSLVTAEAILRQGREDEHLWKTNGVDNNKFFSDWPGAVI